MGKCLRRIVHAALERYKTRTQRWLIIYQELSKGKTGRWYRKVLIRMNPRKRVGAETEGEKKKAKKRGVVERVSIAKYSGQANDACRSVMVQ